MPTTSSGTLESSLTAITNNGYSYAVGGDPRTRDFERVKEQLRQADINWLNTSNIFSELSEKIQPLRDHVARYYPNVQFERDKLDHYGVSLMLAEKLNFEISFGLGVLKEIVDIVGTGFSTEDMDADFAGAMGWDVATALEAGLLIDQSPPPNPARDAMLSVARYMDSRVTDQDPTEAEFGASILSGIQARANLFASLEDIVEPDPGPTPQTNEELIGLNVTQSAKISANVYNGLDVDTNNNIGYFITSDASNTTSNYFEYTITHGTTLSQLFSAAANEKTSSGATSVQYTGSTADYDDAETQRYKGVVSYVADGVYSGDGVNTDTWTFTITTTFTPGDRMRYSYYPDGDAINNPALAEILHTFQSRTDTYTVVETFDYNIPSGGYTAQDVPVDVSITVGQQISAWFGN